jgi:hypothetical protein
MWQSPILTLTWIGPELNPESDPELDGQVMTVTMIYRTDLHCVTMTLTRTARLCDSDHDI